VNKKRKKHKPGIPGQTKQVAKHRVRKGPDAPLPPQPKTPTYEELRTWLSELTPQLAHNAFENFVVVGYRRVPEEERDKYDGQEVVPFYFYDFPRMFDVGALLNWASEDVKKKMVEATAQHRASIAENARQDKPETEDNTT
tara:strand:+ start:120 stop:542 length:423 start_codon:yes stop_codon:yes gene_type:complete